MKKILSLILAVFCVQFLMAQDYGPVTSQKLILGNWSGTLKYGDKETRGMMGLPVDEPLPELEGVTFGLSMTLNFKFAKGDNESTNMEATMEMAFEVNSKNPMTDEFINGLVGAIGNEKAKVETDSKKNKLKVIIAEGPETEVVPKEGFNDLAAQFKISKNKKKLLVETDGMKFELLKK